MKLTITAKFLSYLIILSICSNQAFANATIVPKHFFTLKQCENSSKDTMKGRFALNVGMYSLFQYSLRSSWVDLEEQFPMINKKIWNVEFSENIGEIDFLERALNANFSSKKVLVAKSKLLESLRHRFKLLKAEIESDFKDPNWEKKHLASEQAIANLREFERALEENPADQAKYRPKEVFLAMIREKAQKHSDREFVFQYSGHGNRCLNKRGEVRWCLPLSNFVLPVSELDIFAKTPYPYEKYHQYFVTDEELLAAFNRVPKITLLDSCFSGQAISGFSQFAQDRKVEFSKTIFMAASTDNFYAPHHKKNGGIFTTSLVNSVELDSFGLKRSDINRDGIIEGWELANILTLDKISTSHNFNFSKVFAADLEAAKVSTEGIIEKIEDLGKLRLPIMNYSEMCVGRIPTHSEFMKKVVKGEMDDLSLQYEHFPLSFKRNHLNQCQKAQMDLEKLHRLWVDEFKASKFLDPLMLLFGDHSTEHPLIDKVASRKKAQSSSLAGFKQFRDRLKRDVSSCADRGQLYQKLDEIEKLVTDLYSIVHFQFAH